MSDASDIYRQIVAISEDYFGPASQRFVDRIIREHLHKSPAKISSKDIPAIVVWTRLTVALLTENRKDIEQFTRRLERLARKHKAK